MLPLLLSLALTALLVPPTVTNAWHGAPVATSVNLQQSAGTDTGPAPLEGPPGSRFRVSGSNFYPFASVRSITLGGVEVLGSRVVNTDGDGSFTVADLLVPDLDAGTYPLLIRVAAVGGGDTTSVHTFRVTAQSGVDIRQGLDQLILDDNVERVFFFDNLSKSWLFFDPRPAFSSANTLTALANNQIYWVKVKRDQSLTLNGDLKDLTCIGEGTPQEDCWNQIVW